MRERDKMNRSWIISLIIIVLMLYPAQVSGQRLNIKHYDSRDGLPQDQILAIGQDAMGYLWAGTYIGLARFNGREWTSFTTREGLHRNTISAIGLDNTQNLLVGMQNGGINSIGRGQIQSFPLGDWPDLDVEKILTTRNGDIWFAAQEGALLAREGSTRLFTTADGLPHNHCQALWEDASGALYVGTQKGLAIIEASQVRPIDPATADLDIRTIHRDRSGRLILGTSQGLYLADGTAWKPEVTAGLDILCGTLDHDGTLWLGTAQKGILYLRGEETGFLDLSSGLLENHILVLFVDQINNLWIGTDKGLSRLTASPFRVLTSAHGLVNDFARTMFIDRDKRLWIGTRDGVSYVDQGFQIKTLDTSQFVNTRIYGITQHPDGSILFATDEGLTVWKDGVVRNHTEMEGFPLARLRSIHNDGKRIWLGPDCLLEWKDGKLTGFPEGHPLARIKIIDMVSDQEGWLWIAAFRGLLAYNPETGEVRTFEKHFDLTVWDLTIDRDGRIWMGTNGMGLFIYDHGQFKNISSRDGLANDFVWHVLAASNGDIWAGHTDGLDRVRGDQISHFDTNDGLAANEGSATACIEDLNGGYWFGTAQGITYYHQDLEPHEQYQPVIHLESILASDGEVPLDSGLTFPRWRNTLTFRYAGLLFGREDRLEFSYQLEGLEEEWCKPTTATEVTYRSLPRGDYTFLVRTRLSQGPWVQEQQGFSFSIPPYFWETIWFRALVVLMLLVLIGVIFRIKNLSLKKNNQLLSKLVDERTRALSSKNEELKISEQRSRAMFEQADVSIVLFEQKTGVFKEFNDMAHENLGYSREDFQNLRIHDIEGFSDAEFPAYLEKILNATSENVETTHKTCDGKVRDVVMRSRPIEIHGVNYILGIWRDVTTQKNVRNQLLIAEKMASLGRLTAGIAHEMNTPIAAVRTSLVELETLVTEYSSSAGNPEVTPDDHREIAEEMRQAIEIAKKAAARAAGFVQSTKSQTRNLEGRKSFLFKAESVVQESLLLLSHALRAGKSEALFSCDDPNVEVFGAPGWLAQVVTNLVTNAIDANEEKGGGKIWIKLKKEGEHLSLEIADQGPGIDPAISARIFDPMFTTKPIGKGTGLGLTIVHDIITGQLGGTITLESRPGEGTTFFLKFPMKKEADSGENI